MHEQRWERQHRHDVGPVEDPVEPVQLAAVREATDAEEGDRQPEEMQRRRVAGALHAHGAPHQQRENRDGREGVVQQARAIGNGLELDPERTLVPRTRDDVREAAAALAAVLCIEHLLDAVHATAVDGDQHVARLNPGLAARGVSAHRRGDDSLGAGLPQHAVLDLDPGETYRDVGRDQDEQHGRHQHGHRRTAPLRAARCVAADWPVALGHRWSISGRRHGRQVVGRWTNKANDVPADTGRDWAEGSRNRRNHGTRHRITSRGPSGLQRTGTVSRKIGSGENQNLTRTPPTMRFGGRTTSSSS